MLALDATGDYAFRVPPELELHLDGALLADAARGGVRVSLPRGNHLLSVVGTEESSETLPLQWRTPGNSDWQNIPPELLFLPPPGGIGLSLKLSDGTLTDEAIDPVVAHYYQVSPFSRLHLDPAQWTADWSGELDVPASGTYTFALEHSHVAEVWLDELPLLGNYGAATDTRNAVLQLTAGRHPIRVRFEKTEGGSPRIDLSWMPPGAKATPIPTSALFPVPPQPHGPAT